MASGCRGRMPRQVTGRGRNLELALERMHIKQPRGRVQNLVTAISKYNGSKETAGRHCLEFQVVSDEQNSVRIYQDVVSQCAFDRDSSYTESKEEDSSGAEEQTNYK